MVRWDFERVVTRKYVRKEIAAAMAALPWTTACSPKTMTLPGAETIKGGAIGDDAFLFVALEVRSGRSEGALVACPLTPLVPLVPLTPLTLVVPLVAMSIRWTVIGQECRQQD